MPMSSGSLVPWLYEKCPRTQLSPETIVDLAAPRRRTVQVVTIHQRRASTSPSTGESTMKADLGDAVGTSPSRPSAGSVADEPPPAHERGRGQAHHQVRGSRG